MFLDPVALLPVLLKLRLQNGDGLQQHTAVRFEQPIAGSEVVVIVFVTHGFKHFDAHDLVELPAQVAVVFEQQLDALPRSALREHFPRIVVLLPADGRGCHAAPVGLGRVCCKAAPASSDFEHVVAWTQLQLAADAVELVDLCLFQRVIHAVVIGAGIS